MFKLYNHCINVNFNFAVLIQNTTKLVNSDSFRVILNLSLMSTFYSRNLRWETITLQNVKKVKDHDKIIFSESNNLVRRMNNYTMHKKMLAKP